VAALRGRMAGWYAILLALMALTLGLYEFVPRYERSDRQVLGSLESDGDLATWWTTGHVRARAEAPWPHCRARPRTLKDRPPAAPGADGLIALR
jgi:hypothetical protein